MAISGAIIQKLLLLLRPHLQDEKERKGYLIRALGTKADALNLIWSQPVNTFIPNMVQELVAFGEASPGQPALSALLEVIREDVGVDTQDSIDKLLQQIREELQKAEITGNSNQTTDALIEQVEHYLSDPKNYIALDKLLVREAKALAEVMQGELEACPWELYPHNQTQCQQCIEYLEYKSQRFVRMLAKIVHYGRQEEFIELIAKAFRIIVKPPSPYSFNDAGVYIRLYPQALAIYTVFVLGVNKQSHQLLRTILDIQFKWSVPPDCKMVESLVCLFRYTDQVFKSALGENNIIPVTVRIKRTLSTWLNELLEEADTDFWKGEFVLSLAFIESDRKFYWPALYLFEWKANSELKNFLRIQPLWLMELYQNLEDMLQIFDVQAEKAASFISPFGGGFRGGAISAFRGKVWY